MPSNHLILCRPLILQPSIFPSIRVFSNESVLCNTGQNIGVSASASVLSKNIQDWYPLGWTGWISLLSKGLSRVFWNTTVQKHQFFGAQFSLQSNSHNLSSGPHFIRTLRLGGPTRHEEIPHVQGQRNLSEMIGAGAVAAQCWSGCEEISYAQGQRRSSSKVVQFSSVQSLSCVWLFATPWITARQASLSITNSRSFQSSLRLTSIKSVMPSSHLILCHPLLVLPPILPSIRVLSNESTLRMKWPKYWSFSFSIIPSKEIPGLISFRMDWLDLLAVQGTLKSLLQHHNSKASILWCSAFFTVQLSHPYMTTGKT